MRLKTFLAVIALLVLLVTLGASTLIHLQSLLPVRRGPRKPTQITYSSTEINSQDESLHRAGVYVDYTRWDGGWARESEQVGFTSDPPQSRSSLAPRSPLLTIYVPDRTGKRWVGANFDPLTSHVITMDLGSAEKIIYRTPLPSPDQGEKACHDIVAREAGGGGDNFSCEEAGHKILGFPVWTAHWQRGTSGRLNLTDVTEELAPSLNWAPLRRVISRHSDGKTFREFHAIKVVESDPPERLFHVPRTATMVPQDQFWLLMGQARHIPNCDRCLRPQANRAYNNVQPAY